MLVRNCIIHYVEKTGESALGQLYLADSVTRIHKGLSVATLISPNGPTKGKRAPDLQHWSIPA